MDEAAEHSKSCAACRLVAGFSGGDWLKLSRGSQGRPCNGKGDGRFDLVLAYPEAADVA